MVYYDKYPFQMIIVVVIPIIVHIYVYQPFKRQCSYTPYKLFTDSDTLYIFNFITYYI